jgi:predicted phage terminase large subunit-like protein
MSKRIITPQKGAQERFLASKAQICIYGGAAGGGKTCGMLIDALRWKDVQGFGAVFFRKNYNQIFSQGGLWDESMKLYNGVRRAYPQLGRGRWVFRDKNGKEAAKISFAHIERDQEVYKWQGSQICGLYFDELTHFSERIFFYMLSRNRSLCGVTPYVRASTNPDADSWVAKFIDWWIDPETGYPIKERSGAIRWMLRRDEQIYWADTKEELIEQFHLVTPEEVAEPKSVTFIASTIYDNQILLKSNPSYLANLKALPVVERERLLQGNWKIKPAAGLFFKRTQVRHILDTDPLDVISWARAWDLAATAEDEGGEPAYTAGVLMGKRKDGTYVIADVINKRLAANEVRQLIKLTAEQDRAKYKVVHIRLPKDPGQAGKDQAQNYIKFLSGFAVKAVAETGSKEARAEPVAAQWQAGNIDLVYGAWNEMYLDQLESFPMSRYKDMVDATSAAFTELDSTFDITNLL